MSLYYFRRKVEFPVLRYFLSAAAAAHSDGDDIDVIKEGSIDLGEVVAETLALELDPYPRREGEEFVSAAEIAPEPVEKSFPFAVLSRLKRE